jgi:hypothetical protein
MEVVAIGRVLSDFTAAKTVDEASRLAPHTPGIYLIHIADPDLLVDPWQAKLRKKESHLLYVGKAGDSLHRRLVEEELRHKRPATFFRGLGAVLGYRPTAGSLVGKSNQNNYGFSKVDTLAIVDWIATNLRVCWKAMPLDQVARNEAAVIGMLRPLFNTVGNPDCCSDLARARDPSDHKIHERIQGQEDQVESGGQR